MTGQRVTVPIDLDTIAIGDHVTSRWQRHGLIWQVTHVGWLQRPPLTLPHRLLDLEAIESGQRNTRSTSDLVKVVTA